MVQKEYMNALELKSMDEIKEATNKLDKATLCPLKLVDNGVDKLQKNFKGVYNISKGVMSSAVGNSYHLIQHKEYFDTFCQALNNLGVKYTAVVNQTRNTAMLDISFENKNVKFEKLGEEFTTGLRLVNSYNRMKGLSIAPRYTRLACTNGMVISRFDVVFSVRHNSKLLEEMEVLVETKINSIINNNNELKVWVSDSMGDSVEWNIAVKILEKMITSEKHREYIFKQLGISVIETKEKGKKKKLNYVLDDAKKNTLTRWDIYNSITQYATHGQQITPNLETFLQKQAEKVLVTKLEKLPRMKVVI